ncbi:MAG TPA: chromosomal replication initiator protein DnaA [Bacteriovoracaceae bacterium]|nr:chromosomal replication initiator protein DnaA [Bacteriovoracaceae bacterium]
MLILSNFKKHLNQICIIMTQKFLNHFFKLDGLSQNGTPEVSPVIIEKALSELNNESSPMTRDSSEFNSEELKSITEELLEHIKEMINSNKFQAYFANTFTISAINNGTVDFVVTTSFIKKMVETHYLDTVGRSLSKILGKDYEVRIQVLGSGPISTTSLSSNNENILKSSYKNKKPDSVKNSTFFMEDLEPTKDDKLNAIESKVMEHQSPVTSGQIDPIKTFNNFIIGPSNNIAHAFSMAVAKDPGKAYPALYIYGNSGLGKTHLIHAIANYIQNRNPSTRICMTSANRFMNEMVESIKSNKSYDFRRKYTENTDLLVIDDIHELKNKTTTQEMFFHIFNELIERGKQLVFTSDKIPKEIDGLEDRIRTRLSSALPVEIQQPDLETRIAILKKKAIEKDMYLSDDVVNLIAKCVKSNIRELEGCLVKLGAVSSVLKVDIDLEVAKEHLKLNEELENQKNVTIESISKNVANYYKIPIGDLRGKAKTKEVALARQVSMYLVSKMLRPTLKENGHYFSGRDHSTVLHAIKTITDRIKIDTHLAQQLLEIEKQL